MHFQDVSEMLKTRDEKLLKVHPKLVEKNWDKIFKKGSEKI